MTVNRRSFGLKVTRAAEQFAALEEELKAYSRRDGVFTLMQTSNADFTEHCMSMVFNEEPPLDRWGSMFAEGVQSLRSALDHLVYAIAVHESGRNPPPDASRLMFPILDPPGSLATWRIRTLSAAVQAAIEAAQPDPGNPGASPLWELNKINQADKHRLVTMSSGRIMQADIPVSGLNPGDQCMADWRMTGLETGEPFLTLTCENPAPDVKIEIETILAYFGLECTGWGRPQIYTPPIEVLAKVLLGHVQTVVSSLLTAAGE